LDPTGDRQPKGPQGGVTGRYGVRVGVRVAGKPAPFLAIAGVL
jgi:hypothetical protein